MDDQAATDPAPAATAPVAKGPPSPVLNRRTVLAAATAAGIGVAASRLMALANDPAFTRVPLTGSLANKGGLDWVSPLDSEPARVSHLLRRATFGATQVELDQAQKDGYAKTVDRLLETKIVEPPAFPGGEEASQEKGLNVGQLQQWWVDHMASTPTPRPAAVAAARPVRRLSPGLAVAFAAGAGSVTACSSMLMQKIRSSGADVAPRGGENARLYGLLAVVDDQAANLLTSELPRSKVSGPPSLTLR